MIALYANHDKSGTETALNQCDGNAQAQGGYGFDSQVDSSILEEGGENDTQANGIVGAPQQEAGTDSKDGIVLQPQSDQNALPIKEEPEQKPDITVGNELCEMISKLNI